MWLMASGRITREEGDKYRPVPANCRRTGRTVMCRSIKVLRNPQTPATDAEIEAAALQFVRKISGYRQPSRANAEAFDAAVAEIAEASRRLLSQLTGAGSLKPDP